MADWIFDGTVINVVDGDTVDILLKKQVDVGFHTVITVESTQRLRLARINAPELHGENSQAGEASKEFLKNYLLNQPTSVETKKTDIYGRYVAEITLNGQNVSDYLVSNGFAVYQKY